MKNKTFLASSVALVALGSIPATSMAQMSANVGWVSDYIFRGVYQEDSSASAGFDYESGGFYVGTWGADVGSGMETDLYFGYGGSSGDFSYGIGATGYYYTDDWDDTYTELNLSAGYGMFTLDVAVGEWDGFGSPADYTFTSLTIETAGPYFTFGSWGDDFDGDYLEIGYAYSMEESGIDLSIALIMSDDLPLSNGGDNDDPGEYALVFGVTKSIEIGAR